MREAHDLPSPVRIRRANAGDLGFVRQVATAVFSHLGDYGRILPTWLLHDGVITHLAERGEVPVGYTMLGFYPIPRDQFVADLLAIAVAPAAQGRGAGRQLLGHALDHVRAAQRRLPLRELRLSVAETNARARGLFVGQGFRVIAGDHGFYDGGQLALHMTRRV